MIKILVADDHAIVRRGFRDIVSDVTGIHVESEATTHPEVLKLVSEKRYDAIVLDLNMPGGNGLETLKQIKALKPAVPVLILSFRPEEQYALRVLKAGASGYLTKESAPEELVAAIRKVAAGGKYVSSSVAEHLVLDLGRNPEKELHEILSDREYEVMRQIASGKPVGQIARETSLSPKTVSTYRARILTKLGMKNNSELTRYALEQGLVD